MSYIFIILFVVSLLNVAYCLEISSNFFAMDLIVFAQGGGPTLSTNNVADFTLIGEETAYLEELLSTNLRLLSGQIFLFLPSLRLQTMKLISDLRALTERGGRPILEAVWQKDNDPYFYWNIEVVPEKIVSAFSVSLDTKPDRLIDTTSPFYQFSEKSITSGKHMFFVLPLTSDKEWDEDSLLEFELFVDIDPPLVNQLRPQPGELIQNNLVTVSCLVFDEHSGLDLPLTTLSMNGHSLSFDYDPEEKLIHFEPTSPFPEGENTVLLKVYDVAGNYVAKGWNFLVDTQPPFGGIKINNGEEVTHSSYVNIDIEAKDSVSGVKNIYISNDGVFDTEMLEPRHYSPVIGNWLLAEPEVDGTKTVYVKFEDFAGNVSQAYTAQIKLKLSTPQTNIISGPVSVTEETEAHFRYEASVPNADFSYKLDNNSWSEWLNSNEVDFSGLLEGNHYFYVKSGFDLNGDGKITIDEEDATPAQWIWTIKAKGDFEKLRKRILFWKR